MSRPLAIDLYTGLHGWAEGLIAAGFYVVGFDIEDMARLVGEPLPPEHFSLVIQDVLTLHGSQFRNAELIVGSSPCQEFSYRAMPFKAAKGLGPPELGKRLFEAQFRIQREASAASGRPIPLVVENVRGAQPWVGRAKMYYGPFALWGDVPALLPIEASRKLSGSWFHGYAPGSQGPRNHASGSKARRVASAKIAKIPFSLAHWIGRANLSSTRPHTSEGRENG